MPDKDWFEEKKRQRLIAEAKFRRRVNRIILAVSLSGAAILGGVLYGASRAHDVSPKSAPVATATGSPTTVAPSASGLTEQELVNAAADYIAKHPYTDHNKAVFTALLAASRCHVTGLSILPGAVPGPPPAGVFMATRKYGPKYVDSEGDPFTLVMAVTC